MEQGVERCHAPHFQIDYVRFILATPQRAQHLETLT
jgi:hypothetical protein